LVEARETVIAPMRLVQPWPTGDYAEALVRGRSAERA